MSEKPSNEKILEMLRSEPTEYVSGEALCEALRVSRSAIWKHIESLRSLGYTIEAFPHRGYRLVGCPDKLLSEELMWNLKTELIGRQVLSYDMVASTNDVAYDLGKKGAREGTVVVSEGQTKGKGRLGRSWVSPKGKGIYFSILLRPILPPQSIPKLTLLAALSVARAIRQITNLTPQIRWPNDLLLNGKKVSGILTEMSAEQDRVHFVVVGIGVNVNTTAEFLPKEGTSLKIETGSFISRIPLAQSLLEAFDTLYRDFKEGKTDEALEECRKLSAILGTHVTVEQVHGKKEGYAVDIDSEGALLLRFDDGVTERILSGDLVKLR
ncbi:MAG: biotin--[acetyl-CoA-carboxylase] ligase [Candidatus Omnitrophica bacterium]|nr:biotin--[acetyl-CoA-carboxylase] ligase [Candidatus Omnitrophota bacterium]